MRYSRSGYSVKHYNVSINVIKQKVASDEFSLEEKLQTTKLQNLKLQNYKTTKLQKCEHQKKKAINGEFGKTPHYWMQYINLIDHQYKLQFAIKTNDYEVRLKVWDESLLIILCS